MKRFFKVVVGVLVVLIVGGVAFVSINIRSKGVVNETGFDVKNTEDIKQKAKNTIVNSLEENPNNTGDMLNKKTIKLTSDNEESKHKINVEQAREKLRLLKDKKKLSDYDKKNKIVELNRNRTHFVSGISFQLRFDLDEVPQNFIDKIQEEDRVEDGFYQFKTGSFLEFESCVNKVFITDATIEGCSEKYPEILLSDVVELRINHRFNYDYNDLNKLLNLKHLYLENVKDFDFEKLDLLDITLIDISYSANINTDHLLKFKKLESIKLVADDNNDVKYELDLDFIAEFKALRAVHIENYEFDSVFINRLLDVESLSIINGELKNIEFLYSFPKLKKLNLSHNRIRHIPDTIINNNLWWLEMSWNHIENIEMITNFPNLKYISFDLNMIIDIFPLYSLDKLTILKLNRNHITSIDNIYELESLNVLEIDDNHITDCAPFYELTNLISNGECKEALLK